MSSHERRPESFKENLASQLSRRARTLEFLKLKTDGLEQGFGAWIEKNGGLLEAKYLQGLDRLLIVPAGFSPQQGIKLLGSLTNELRAGGKLKDSRGGSITGKPHNDKDVHVWDKVWDEPAVRRSAKPYFFLTEDLPELVRPGTSEVMGGRTQLETGLSPQEYRKLLANNPQYQGEYGYTREDILIDYLTRLSEKKIVSDIWTMSYALGEDTSTGSVLESNWNPDDHRFDLDSDHSGHGWSGFGARVAVKGE